MTYWEVFIDIEKKFNMETVLGDYYFRHTESQGLKGV